jgi:hypothetical protein
MSYKKLSTQAQEAAQKLYSAMSRNDDEAGRAPPQCTDQAQGEGGGSESG